MRYGCREKEGEQMCFARENLSSSQLEGFGWSAMSNCLQFCVSERMVRKVANEERTGEEWKAKSR